MKDYRVYRVTAINEEELLNPGNNKISVGDIFTIDSRHGSDGSFVFFDGKRLPPNTSVVGITLEEAIEYMVEEGPTSLRVILKPVFKRDSNKFIKEDLLQLDTLLKSIKRLSLHDDVSGRDYDVELFPHYRTLMYQSGCCAFVFKDSDYDYTDKHGMSRKSFRMFPSEEYNHTWKLYWF